MEAEPPPPGDSANPVTGEQEWLTDYPEAGVWAL